MVLTIRRKIILAFVVFIVVSGTIWTLSYYNLFIMRRKLELIEQKESLFNMILEARRYEKNFLLNNQIRNLEQALDYARHAKGKMEQIVENLGKYAISKDFGEKIQDLHIYTRLIESYLQSGENRSFTSDLDTFEHRIQTIGKHITEYLENTVNMERRYVRDLFETLKLYLFVAMMAILILIVLMAFYLYHNVNLPLKTIEKAISRITAGDFSEIPKLSEGDEFESFVDSLNQMIFELNRRGDQLVQSEKLASLGTLTSGVAHELNNPLNNISTSLQILLEELDDGDTEFQRGLLTESEREVERIRDIVRALLEFSRKHPFVTKKVHFKKIIEDSMRLIRGEIPSKVKIEVEVSEDIEAFLDPRRIQQALINLIINGIQAMKNGGRITIRAWKDDTGKLFTFSVEDTGEGIPKDMVGKVFDPFFTTKDVGQGSGLGLSVTHGIIDQHGGRISVESEPGKGTKFIVSLPMEVKGDDQE